ncbi:conserved unknown protein [Ectocarpus siliculosus]|uniref:SURP motif domain-containing protein n=1 Tax=Ectocarpus siliculosus TaxID=2880 RepID=D7FJ62_ECTSI|nr:conserved unknown protein [Ectocarpus siliculosus]|eukprot:CBJ28972.1 conserved unknown protein [Ectocarpus siliculosus]
MGVRKEGSGKSRSTESYHGKAAPGGAAAGADRDSDEDSDPELQQLYVQSYACQVFRDDPAATAVQDGAHLRPLTVPQDPEGEPLMLDRFDARWMLDLSDFSKGTGSALPVKLEAEERKADGLRYEGLPSGDHSLVVEGLGQFAPTGSYAHGGSRGGLGDEEEEEEPEVYGYYGRTASPPPTSANAGRGAWATAQPPPPSADADPPPAPAAVAVGDGTGGGGSEPTKGAGGDQFEEFVADFGIPEELVAPATFRQHMMMVGTARTAVRSPQLEVLLRLKQQANEAFSFLSDEDPVHPYYLFLKSWGESALAAEYARQQRLQAERAEARQRQDQQRKEREAAAAKDLKFLAGLSLGAVGAPNLLGGAYESSEDEEDNASTAAAVPPATAAPTGTTLPLAAGVSLGEAGGSVGEGVLLSPAVPGEEKRQVVEKMVGYVAKNGQAFEDRVRKREVSNPTFDFLNPANKFHAYYKRQLALAKGEPVSPAPGQGNTGGAPATGGSSNSDVRRAAAAVPGSSASQRPSSSYTASSTAASVGGASCGIAVGGGTEGESAKPGAPADQENGSAASVSLTAGKKRRRPQDESESGGSNGNSADGDDATSTAAGPVDTSSAEGNLREKLGDKLGIALSTVNDRRGKADDGRQVVEGDEKGEGDPTPGSASGRRGRVSAEGKVRAASQPEPEGAGAPSSAAEGGRADDEETRSSRKDRPHSRDSTRSRVPRAEDSGGGGRERERRSGESHRKSRRDKDVASRREDRRDGRRGRSRSNGRSRPSGGGGRTASGGPSRSDRDRSSRAGDGTDWKRSDRNERGDRDKTSSRTSAASSRKPESSSSRRERDGRAGGNNRERVREKPRGDRETSGRRSSKDVRKEGERAERSSRRSRSRDRGESRERGGSNKRSRRR